MKKYKQSVPYEKALKDSGFNEKLVYNKENTTSNEHECKRVFGLIHLILVP